MAVTANDFTSQKTIEIFSSKREAALRFLPLIPFSDRSFLSSLKLPVPPLALWKYNSNPQYTRFKLPHRF